VNVGSLYFTFIQDEDSGHLKAIAQIGIVQQRGAAVPLDDRGLKSAHPVHESQQLRGGCLTETEGPVEVLLGIFDVVNREKPVFPEKLFGSFGILRHVHENYPETLVFELGSSLRDVADSLPAKRTAEEPEKNEQNWLLFRYRVKVFSAIGSDHRRPKRLV